jgi:nicotinamidase-related amidase
MKMLGKKVIFENPQEIVNPEHTALVIWDSQNELVSRIFNPVEYLANLKGLLDAAHRHEVPVIYAKISPEAAGYQSGWSIYKSMKRFKVDDPTKIPIMKAGSPQSEIHSAIAPIEGDQVINRPVAGIFFGTDFQQWMRNRGVQTILVAGISTEQGVENTTRDAGRCGFYPVVVSDCVSSMDRTVHDMALKIMSSLFIVMSSKDIMKLWGG